TLSWMDLPGLFSKAMRDSAAIMVIIGAISAANWVMTFNRVPNEISAFVLRQVESPTIFLLTVLALLLVAGLFIEGTAAMLVLVPILHPIAVQLGIDPIHFAIIVIFNLMIGLITPPMGLCLFVADSIAGVGLASLTRRILPMVIVEILVLLLLTFVPQLVTALPHALGY
ncbi:MAG: TRAP transporter large permease subunit, partial [Deltaproteobacteria bacterium]|nr:TRAP transporter large permease subunit [Deltaproteobacteria bacterium]